jgi:hypothetical protein
MRNSKLHLFIGIFLLGIVLKTEAQELAAFDSCFEINDITNEQITIGCSTGFYKLINPNTILRIFVNPTIGYNECMEIELGEFDSFAQLLIFSKEQKQLMNICTDVIIVNADKPIQILKATSGKLRFEKSDPTDYYGNQMPKVSIFVEELKFHQPKSKKEILIKDELFWKVLDTGIQG